MRNDVEQTCLNCKNVKRVGTLHICMEEFWHVYGSDDDVRECDCAASVLEWLGWHTFDADWRWCPCWEGDRD